MHICMLTSEFPPDLGGISYYVSGLSRRLMKRGHDVTVITRGNWRRSYHNEENGIPVYRVQFIPSYPSIFGLHGIWVNRLLKSLEPSISLLHVHGSLVPVINTSRPFVFTAHGTVKGDIDNMPIRSFRFLVVKGLGKQLINAEKRLFDHADVVTVVSHSCEEEIRAHHGLNKRIVAIPPGIDTNYFAPPEDRIKGDTYVLYTGRLETRKGLVDLVRAAKYVCEKYPDIEFILTGKGTAEAYLRRLVRNLGVGRNFHFVGYVDRDALLRYYQNATIYALPSYYEGLPATLIEAMSCGIPPVATNVRGISEVITDGETGLLVPSRNPEKLAEAMVKLLNCEKSRKEIGSRARKYIKDNYEWELITDKLEELYTRVVASK